MKKIISLAIVLIMALTMLAGCAGSDTLKVGVLIYKYDDTYIAAVRQAIEQEAANYGSDKVTLLLNDGKNDQAVQNDQIDVLISQNVDVLAVNIVNNGAAETVIDKAKAAGIPLLFFNREPTSDVIKSYEGTVFIGTKPEEAGIIQGEMMTKIWNDNPQYDKNGDGVMQYVMLQGEADNPEALARTEYSIKTVDESGIQTKQLAMQVANWDADRAKTAMDAWLANYGDQIEFVVSNNDGMASGAIASLQSAGYNVPGSDKIIPVVGVDATDEAVKLINDGVMSGSVKQDAQAMGKAVFTVAMNLAEGKSATEGTSYQYDETGVAIRIPYQPYYGENT